MTETTATAMPALPGDEDAFDLSISIETGPRIGVRKGPPLFGVLNAAVAAAPSRRRGGGATAALRVWRVGGWSGAVLEAPAFVAGLDDVTVVGEAVKERRGHLGVAEE